MLNPNTVDVARRYFDQFQAFVSPADIQGGPKK